MAQRNIQDFKMRSRSNVVNRVGMRVNFQEKKRKDYLTTQHNSVVGSSPTSMVAKALPLKKISRNDKNVKVMSYHEVKQWSEKYHLDGKHVYQLEAEFTSLVNMQV